MLALFNVRKFESRNEIMLAWDFTAFILKIMIPVK